ncbi:MAG TPA: hypothetical protein VK538_01815, partial [Solirubrobacteraceae bacterium]|nr:hypothetical protein [Solirubrobacteraceae bacterium]
MPVGVTGGAGVTGAGTVTVVAVGAGGPLAGGSAVEALGNWVVSEVTCVTCGSAGDGGSGTLAGTTAGMAATAA